MVQRVSLSLFSFIIVLIALMIPMVHAGGPPVVGCEPAPAPCIAPPCPPPSCGPPPCGPPLCGPGLGPFIDIFGACQSVLGAAISIPATIMGAILAPPRCGPPPCGPPPCPPPMCGPPACTPPLYMPVPCEPPVCGPPPARITKCKPVSQIPRYPNFRRRSGMVPMAPMGYGPGYGPNHTCARPAPSFAPMEYLMLCNSMLEVPFKLASGALCAVEPSSCGRPYFATMSKAVTAPLFGGYW